MTRAEKVRKAIADAIPVVSLHGSSDETARLIEALSLLDGCVIVPREPNEAMQSRLTDLVRAMHPDQHSRDMAAWEAIKGYRAMIAASEEGE